MKEKSESQKELAYLPYLDGWRGIAIILVLISHFITGERYDLGHFGVSIFFVLSGFLMSRILFIKKVPLNVFYRRRFARILPAFLLYVCVIFFIGWAFFNRFDINEFIPTLFFLRSYFPDLSMSKTYVPIGHFWSLNVEEHCYILLSLVSLLSIRFGESAARITLTLCSMLCVIFFVFYKYNPPISQSIFSTRSEVAALPLLLSCGLFLWLNKYKINVSSIVPILSLFGALTISAFSTSVFLSYIMVSLLLAISINTLNTAPIWFLKALSNKVLRWFGVCSYSIYLWQQVFFFSGRYANNLVYPTPPSNPPAYYSLVFIGLSVLVGSCSFYFFENPMRKWLSGRGT